MCAFDCSSVMIKRSILLKIKFSEVVILCKMVPTYLSMIVSQLSLKSASELDELRH